MKIVLNHVKFTFLVSGKEYSVQWYSKDSPGYSAYAASAAELPMQYEVQLFRGGGYKYSTYTSHAANKSNSLVYLKELLINEINGKIE